MLLQVLSKQNFRVASVYEQYKGKCLLGALAGHIASEQQVILKTFQLKQKRF